MSLEIFIKDSGLISTVPSLDSHTTPCSILLLLSFLLFFFFFFIMDVMFGYCVLVIWCWCYIRISLDCLLFLICFSCVDLCLFFYL